MVDKNAPRARSLELLSGTCQGMPVFIMAATPTPPSLRRTALNRRCFDGAHASRVPHAVSRCMPSQHVFTPESIQGPCIILERFPARRGKQHARRVRFFRPPSSPPTALKRRGGRFDWKLNPCASECHSKLRRSRVSCARSTPRTLVAAWMFDDPSKTWGPLSVASPLCRPFFR